MTYKEAVSAEGEAPRGVIRLIKDGAFYRAYNRSAWLFECCIAEYKVARRYVKSLKEYVWYIGFPVERLFDTIGERKAEKTEYGFDVTLAEDELPDEAAYESWKETTEAAEAGKGDYYALPLVGAAAEKEVLKRLREWPIESKTLVETLGLVVELRKLLNNR